MSTVSSDTHDGVQVGERASVSWESRMMSLLGDMVLRALCSSVPSDIKQVEISSSLRNVEQNLNQAVRMEEMAPGEIRIFLLFFAQKI